MTLLQVDSLGKRFGELEVLRDVTFSVGYGERLAIIGPNGAGKTTLFNLIGGLYSPSAGRILFEGRDITAWQVYRRAAAGISRTFQVASLFDGLTVLENSLLAHVGTERRWSCWWRPLECDRQLVDRAFSLLEDYGLVEYHGVQVRHLSYGIRRRLEIAMAMAGRPKLLLLDEPAAGLSGNEALTVLRHLATIGDAAIVLIEHDMDVVFEVADRIIVLNAGSILTEGSGDQIRYHPDVMAAYLGGAR